MEIKNRKAYFNYTITEKYEAGIVLSGNEVKSIRLGKANIKDCYARFFKDELYLINMHIDPYKYETKVSLDPTRQRKLLLKRSELKKLLGQVNRQGVTLIPLKVYLKANHIVKIQIGIASGKRQYEKKESKKLQDLKIETERDFKVKLN